MRLVPLVGVLLLWARPSPAATLRVSPAEFVVQNVPVGRLCDLHVPHGVVLEIRNDDEGAHTYGLSARAPAAATLQEGYAAIPDPAWFTFEPRRVTVAAGATGQSKMFVSIPRDARYYNQHWVVSLAVEAVPEPGSMVALAAYPRAYLETEAKADVKIGGHGATAVAPSVLSIGTSDNGPARSTFRIFNNDSRPHSYTLRVSAGARKILASPGRGWISNPGWLHVEPRAVTIRAGQTAAFTVEAQVPDVYRGTMPAWEAIVFVEPEKGSEIGPSFVRVQAKRAKERQP